MSVVYGEIRFLLWPKDRIEKCRAAWVSILRNHETLRLVSFRFTQEIVVECGLPVVTQGHCRGAINFGGCTEVE